MYVRRSMKNVDSSDGTLAFRLYKSAGTDKTIAYCATGKWGRTRKPGVLDAHRPCLVIGSLGAADADKNVQKIAAFISDHGIRTLNIAGHRAVVGMRDYTQRVTDLLIRAFARFVE